jgi:NitT/TauT family transport system ATP-binding protein
MSAVIDDGVARLTGVSKSYRQRKRVVHALRDCSLTIRRGEFFSLLGPSGTGKTTVLNLLAGFEHPTSGDVVVADRKVTAPGPDRAVVFQSPTLFPWSSAIDNVTMGMPGSVGPRAARRDIASALLAEVGLGDAVSRKPHELSGGMQQRVGIARALAMAPEVLLMDEPFAALDAMTRDAMHDEIETLWSELGLTVLFVTHNVREAVRLSDRTVLMESGPGRVKEIYSMHDLDRPRHLDDPRVTERAGVLTHELKAEVARHVR